MSHRPVPPTGTALRRTGAAAFAVAGALFVLYPAARPYGDLDPATTAAAFSSPWWLASHLAAVLGFVLAGTGLVALFLRHRTTPLAVAAGTWWLGTALTVTYYGAETFALHALGTGIEDPALLARLAEAIRMGPAQVTVFATGLVLLAAAGVLTAVALRSLHGAALPFAAGAVLFLPQFFAEPGFRVVHGTLLGLGCLLLAAHLARRPAAAPVATGPVAPPVPSAA
ncbi:hypothetical protein [Pseudonocardia sp. MH-G8]|uniref:hypothetical protein n=1 Tax=Pseudonocardia sp. MH-G8 TaxID=1854588 RepID=UPI0018E93EA9|nr:hypothetical protein [Pseudonocardia sp. MH-G8]